MNIDMQNRSFWHEYEKRKRQLPKNLTSEEYEKKIKKIIGELEWKLTI